MNRYFRDETGATALEYALIASLIGFVLIGAMMSIGGSVTAMLNGLVGVFT